MGNLKSEISDNFYVLNSSASVAGRLKNCLNYWFHMLKAMDFVLKSGYMLHFHHTPHSCYSGKQQVSNRAQFIRLQSS